MTGGVIMLDTNAFSRIMQGDEHAIAIVNDSSRILLCSVVLGELEAGFLNGSRYQENTMDLLDFCGDARVEKVYSTENVVRHYGELMTALRKAGTKIPTNDIWIGAFAKEHNAMVFSYDHHMTMMEPFGVKLA